MPPELPEVETIRRQLLPILEGAQIQNVQQSTFFPNLLKEKKPGLSFKEKELINLERKGKYLFFKFQAPISAPSAFDFTFISNLGMSGQWRLGNNSLMKTVPHTHLEFLFKLKNGEKKYLSYIDPRRFGRMYQVDQDRSEAFRNTLGDDLEHATWNAQKVYHLIKRYPARTLKKTLLDQKLFAGSGNYIANEICARAGLLPTRMCGDVSLEDCQRIHKAIKVVIRGAIKTQGTTFQGAYRDAEGLPGEGVKHLVVFYQKTCQMCRKTPVEKIYIDGRGTYFCTFCQH